MFGKFLLLLLFELLGGVPGTVGLFERFILPFKETLLELELSGSGKSVGLGNLVKTRKRMSSKCDNCERKIVPGLGARSIALAARLFSLGDRGIFVRCRNIGEDMACVL